MQVKDLIDKLSKFPDDAVVLLSILDIYTNTYKCVDLTDVTAGNQFDSDVLRYMDANDIHRHIF